jgi:2-oxoglutarate dehydrogenase E2 component (dihydrolipoamide succinyltransferase)
MPQLGETVTEGTILKWSKQVGDTIAEDEVLVEISTDKVDTEVPSPVGGTILEILVEEGATVEVGTDLVVIGDADESQDAAPTDEATAQPEAEEPEAEEPEAEEPEAEEPEAEEPEAEEPEAEEPEAEASPEEAEGSPEELHPASETPAGADESFAARQTTTDEITEDEVESFFAEPSKSDKEPQLLSPVVRKLIRENEVDISQIEGSGRGGRITRRDVEAHIAETPAAKLEPAPAPEAEEAEAPAEAEPERVEAPAAKEPEPAPTVKPAPAPAAAAEAAETAELSRLRVRAAENLVQAKRTAAHVWTSVEVDYERVERVRQAHKAEFKAAEGFSLTYLPFIARATIDALKAYPVVNSAFNLEEKTATFYKKVDLGIAIDLNQEGLIVARVRNADGLRLVGIAREIASLAERGRNGELGIDDLSGSTFTITNPGPFGSFMSVPIINVPNVGILSTDTVAKRPTVVTAADGQDLIAIRHIGYLGLTWDHRAFDGSTAVLFLRRIKENLETWDWDQELA